MFKLQWFICALLEGLFSAFQFSLVILVLDISSGDFILHKVGKMNLLQNVRLSYDSKQTNKNLSSKYLTVFKNAFRACFRYD